MRWSLIVGSLAVSLGLYGQCIGLDSSNRIRGREITYRGNTCSEANCREPVDSDESSGSKPDEEPTCEEPTCEEPTCEEKSNDTKCRKPQRKRTGVFSQMFKTHKKCKPSDSDESSCCKQPEPEEPESEEPENGCLKCCKTKRIGILGALKKHHEQRRRCNHC